ncbi:MAG: hypothetical protein MJ095_07500 [Oscillospiraceae bacterium]|nr:hypothetical protein [Oscillospiraceae bacterium]
MKKVISVATTAAMTLSMLAVPAVVCAAEEAATATAAAGVVLQDQTIKKGLTSFSVPVTVTKSAKITSAELGLSAEMYFGGIYKAVISKVSTEVEGLNAEIKDGKVSVTGSADVKKGDTIATVTVDIIDGKGNQASSIPENSLFILNVTDAAGDIAATDKADASAFLLVGSASEATASVKFGSSVATVKKNTVEVPVTINGSFSAINTRFRVSNGAKIKDIKVVDTDTFEVSADKTGIVFAPVKISEVKDKEFKNEKVATLVVELPETAVSGQSFEVSAKFFDASNANKEAVPAKVENGDIIYVMKGDGDLNNTTNQQDSIVLLKEVLYRDADSTYFAEGWAADGIDETEEVAYTISKLGSKKLEDAAYEALDSDKEETVKVDASDCSVLLKYILERDARTIDGDITGEEDFLYSDYLAELSAAK